MESMAPVTMARAPYPARHLGTRYTRDQHYDELLAQSHLEAGHPSAITYGRHAASRVRRLRHPESGLPLEAGE